MGFRDQWLSVILCSLIGVAAPGAIPDFCPAGDPYLTQTCHQCRLYGGLPCWESSAANMTQNFLQSTYSFVGEVSLVREPYTPPASAGRSLLPDLPGFFGYLTRSIDSWARSTSLEFDLTDDITEGGTYQPRFVDEIYTEIDTLEDKNDKPYKRVQFKKLFIPMLVILKLFKLKLLLLLPMILGVASFKKLLGIIGVALPLVIGYFKLCKPDLSSSYGSYGHSSYYNRPPHHHYTKLKKSDVVDSNWHPHLLAYNSHSPQ